MLRIQDHTELPDCLSLWMQAKKTVLKSHVIFKSRPIAKPLYKMYLQTKGNVSFSWFWFVPFGLCIFVISSQNIFKLCYGIKVKKFHEKKETCLSLLFFLIVFTIKAWLCLLDLVPDLRIFLSEAHKKLLLTCWLQSSQNYSFKKPIWSSLPYKGCFSPVNASLL